MAVSLHEQSRQYVAANGGYAAVAPTLGITTAHLEEILLGRRRPNAVFAAGLAPLIGVSPALLLNADADAQLLGRRGVL